MIYVPFMDVRSLGVNKYSQLKVIAKDNGSLRDIRTTIESAGYGTVSVSDTVAQIDSLFSKFRLVLSILGLVALSVAALGMFNTLTVSLLERTREVGLMKAMGT
jgi:ABC-type antimicrobial peptide transport system permease subunit